MQVGVAEIVHVNEQMSARTSAHAAGLEETAASMEQLTATVKQNADNASQANKLTAKASEVTQMGRDSVQQIVQTMGGIERASRKIESIVSIIAAESEQSVPQGEEGTAS